MESEKDQSKRLESLTNSWEALLDSAPKSQTDFPKINDISTSDIIIKIEPDGPLIFAHRRILLSNSFFAAFQNFNEWDAGLIKIESIFPNGIMLCIKFLYEKTKPVGLLKSYYDRFLKENYFIEILSCADYFAMDDLIEECCRRFPISAHLESLIASPFFVYTELHLELFKKMMIACESLDLLTRFRLILSWTKGFTEETSTLKTKDVYELLNLSISFDERKTIKALDLLVLVDEFAHFDYVVPFSFIKDFYAPKFKCGGCNLFIQACGIKNGKATCHPNLDISIV